MARKPLTPQRIATMQMDSLAGFVRNLLIENPNFKSGFYATEKPRTSMFICTTLKDLSEAILARIEETKEVIHDLLEEPK